MKNDDLAVLMIAMLQGRSGGGSPGPQGPAGPPGPQGPAGSGGLVGTSWPEEAIDRSYTVTAEAGQQQFKVPLGNWYFDKPGETTVTVNGTPLVLGVGYTHQARALGPNSASVADVCMAVLFTAPCAGGETVVLGWKERFILVDPPQVTLVRAELDGGVWKQDEVWRVHARDWFKAPNAVQATLPPAGYEIELWRHRRKAGGGRNAYPMFPAPPPPPPPPPPLKVGHSDGARYLPYVRGPATTTDNKALFLQGQFDFRSNPPLAIPPVPGMQPNPHWAQYRVCYRNTTTGARSLLSRGFFKSSPNGYDNTTQRWNLGVWE